MLPCDQAAIVGVDGENHRSQKQTHQVNIFTGNRVTDAKSTRGKSADFTVSALDFSCLRPWGLRRTCHFSPLGGTHLCRGGKKQKAIINENNTHTHTHNNNNNYSHTRRKQPLFRVFTLKIYRGGGRRKKQHCFISSIFNSRHLLN